MAAMMAIEKQRAQILDGRPAADAIKREVAEAVLELKRTLGVTPCLAAVLVGDDPASAVYVRNKVRACEEVGIASKHIALDAASSSEALLSVVQAVNIAAIVATLLLVRRSNQICPHHLKAPGVAGGRWKVG